MTRGEFGQHLAKLAAAYRKQIGEATAEVYYEALGDLHPSDLSAAVAWVIQTVKFLPSPSEIRDRARYERAQRMHLERALPPAPEAEAPEWVTEGDLGAMVSDLQRTLSLADHRVTAMRPAVIMTERDGADDERALAERTAKAARMIREFREYNAQRGVTW